ncbi:hypothetical protein BDF14DRAFT_563612 [Spinellus fusiger]|nr:hypothetical protein BDF14DRAFT_563612 [Spinellus fusiger]
MFKTITVSFGYLYRCVLIVGVFLALTVTTVGSILLFHRMYYRGQRLFTYCAQTKFIRPRPVDSMLFFFLMYNIARIIQVIIVITDVSPNIVFRSFLYELPWQFGVAGFSCYFFGIAHTVADTSEKIYTDWFDNPKLIDVVCTCIIFAPFISNNIYSIVAGNYAQNGLIQDATVTTRAMYFMWTLYFAIVFIFIFVAGCRLLRLLNKNMDSRNGYACNLDHIKTCAFKLLDL